MERKQNTANLEARILARRRLHAAAPDLLAALEYALEMQGAVESVRPEGYGTPKATLAWMDEAQSAIARAKGLTPGDSGTTL